MIVDVTVEVLDLRGNLISDKSTLISVVDLDEAKTMAESDLEDHTIVSFITGWQKSKDIKDTEIMLVKVVGQKNVLLSVTTFEEEEEDQKIDPPYPYQSQ